MLELGTCNIACVDNLKFNYEIILDKFTINDVVLDNEKYEYCIQIGMVNSNSNVIELVYNNESLIDNLMCNKFEPQLIDGLYCININPNNIIEFSDNEDIFYRETYERLKLTHHNNCRFIDYDAPSKYLTNNFNSECEISMNKFHLRTQHFEFYNEFEYKPPINNNDKIMQYHQQIIFGIFKIIFYLEYGKFKLKFTVPHNGKERILFKTTIIELDQSINTKIVTNIEHFYQDTLKINVNINNSDEDIFEYDYNTFPCSNSELISNMMCKYKYIDQMIVRSNIDEGSKCYFTQEPTKIDNPIVLSVNTYSDLFDHNNLMFDVSTCESDSVNNFYGYDLIFDQTIAYPEHILYGTKLKTNFIKNDNIPPTMKLRFKSKSIIINQLYLCNQHNYITSNLESQLDDTTRTYTITTVSDQDKLHLTFYKSQYNYVQKCYGFKGRYTLEGLNLFNLIERDFAKYSFYGIGLAYDFSLDSYSPISNSNITNNYGDSISTTNIIPFSDIENIEYITHQNGRFIEIHGVIKDLRTKLNISDNYNRFYLFEMNIIFKLNDKFYQLASSGQLTVKVVDLDEDLPIILIIEY